MTTPASGTAQAGVFSGTWDTTTSSNGSHTITAIAQDAAGNTKTSSSVRVSVTNVAPTSPPPGGGGGGNNNFTPTVPQCTKTVTKTLLPSNLSNLKYGTRSSLVRELQNFLITNGYLAYGYNTGYYGNLTLAALNKYNLEPLTKVINTCIVSRLSKTFRFTRNLKLGMSGQDVRNLQIFLNDQGYTVSITGPGSKGQESTYFGPATYRALIKFQDANRVTILVPNGLVRGTGFFGVSSIKVINQILAR